MENKTNPLVSIIIPHYNNYLILEECIKSLKKNQYNNIEIIVVDNASKDDSVLQIENNFPDIIIKKSKRNLGYAGGCNFGSKNANGEYLLFLNNDTIHNEFFLDGLVKVLNNNPEVACVQPKIKNYNNKEFFDYAGASGGYIDYLVFPFCRGRIFYTIEKDSNQYDNKTNVFWTSGTAFLTRKSIFLKLNGFDKKLFAHMEEIDYSWKCYLAGYICCVNPSSMVYHHGAQTLEYNSPYKTYLNHRNSMILLLTNYNFTRSLLLFPIRFILEIISSINDLLRLKFFHFIAHYLALLSVLNINYIYKRRKFNEQIRVRSDNALFSYKIIFNRSIVIRYFINKIKTFNRLSF